MQAGGAVSRGDITSHFANKESFRKHSHEGIDIGFPVGTPLSFASKGEFIKVSRTSSTEREANGGYGSYIDIKLSDKKIARLAHLSSIPSWVKPGGMFNENTVIALSGGAKGAPGSGRSGGPHLHLEQHTSVKGLEETLNGKVDPLQNGLFALLRKGGITSTGAQPPAPGQQPSVSGAGVPSTTPEQQEEETPWSTILKDLNSLYKGLTGKPKIDGAQLQRNSMDMVQSQNIISSAFMSDTYIIAPPTTIASSVNVLGPLPQVDYTMYTSYANLDTSTSRSQRRL
jgi:murein DD-endopeptidase MepM/ murein hydrolase activator NlpD